MSQADEHQTIPGDTAPYAGLRVGDAERKAAIAALGRQWQAGRLDPAEHERRTTLAFAATTRGDLDALFADLPSDPASASGVVDPTASAPMAPTAAAPSDPSASSASAAPSSAATEGAMSWLVRNRGAVYTLIPLVTLALSFVIKTWVVWLLIPIAYTLLGTMSGGAGYGRDRHRNRRGDR